MTQMGTEKKATKRRSDGATEEVAALSIGNRQSAIDNLLFQALFAPGALTAGEKGKRQTVVLMPDGESVIPDGTKLMVDRESAGAVIAAFETHGSDLPFDKNHSTLFRGQKGEEAPAYGWGKRLSYEEGFGILCDVEWTEEGYEDIKAGRYRYLSPVVGYEEKTGRVRRITSCALTNVPATPNMPALAASLTTKGVHGMGLVGKMLQEGAGGATVATAEQKIGELKALLESKGVTLGDGADFVAIVNAAITALKGGESEDAAKGEDAAVAASVRVRLALPGAAGKDVVEKALAELQGHVGYVPGAEHTKVLARVQALEDQNRERGAADLVETYLSQGKLLESNAPQMTWARERAAKDPEGFKALMDGAPVIVPQGRTTPPATPTRPGSGVDEDKLIEKSLADHKGVHKDAMVALQREIMQPHLDAGLTAKAARERCERSHPRIFGAAA